MNVKEVSKSIIKTYRKTIWKMTIKAIDEYKMIEEGDKIPADGIILECQSLGVNESSLTGESAIVYKNVKDDSDNHFKLNMCYAGTDITNGSAIIKITDGYVRALIICFLVCSVSV